MESDLFERARQIMWRRRAMDVVVGAWLGLSLVTTIAPMTLVLATGWTGPSAWRLPLPFTLMGTGLLSATVAILAWTWSRGSRVFGRGASLPDGFLDGESHGASAIEWVLVLGSLLVPATFALVCAGDWIASLIWAGPLAAMVALSPVLLTYLALHAVRSATKTGDIARAQRRLVRLGPLLPAQVSQVLRARLALLLGDLEAAEAGARRGRRPGLPQLRLAILTRVALRRGEHDRAVELLRIWSHVDPVNPEAHLLISLVDLIEGHASEATVQRLQLAEELTSRRLGRRGLLAPIRAARAWAHAVLDHLEDARRDLAEADATPCRVPEWVAEQDLALDRAREVLKQIV